MAARRAQIFSLLEEGANIAQLCDRAKMSKKTAYNYRTEWRLAHGLGRISNPPPVRRQQVVELDAQGLSNTEIAHKMGITCGAVSTHRAVAGLPPRRAHNAVKLPDLGRCKWCGLSNPCTCTGPRHATDHMGRRDEPVCNALGW